MIKVKNSKTHKIEEIKIYCDKGIYFISYLVGSYEEIDGYCVVKYDDIRNNGLKLRIHESKRCNGKRLGKYNEILVEFSEEILEYCREKKIDKLLSAF